MEKKKCKYLNWFRLNRRFSNSLYMYVVLTVCQCRSCAALVSSWSLCDRGAAGRKDARDMDVPAQHTQSVIPEEKFKL